MCLARHKGRKKTLSLPNRPKPFGVMRSLTDEFVKLGTRNWELGTGNVRVAAKFEQVLRLLRTSRPLAENKFKSCGEQVHFHEGKNFPNEKKGKKMKQKLLELAKPPANAG